jgi:hypothetical protein
MQELKMINPLELGGQWQISSTVIDILDIVLFLFKTTLQRLDSVSILTYKSYSVEPSL